MSRFPLGSPALALALMFTGLRESAASGGKRRQSRKSRKPSARTCPSCCSPAARSSSICRPPGARPCRVDEGAARGAGGAASGYRFCFPRLRQAESRLRKNDADAARGPIRFNATFAALQSVPTLALYHHGWLMAIDENMRVLPDGTYFNNGHLLSKAERRRAAEG